MKQDFPHGTCEICKSSFMVADGTWLHKRHLAPYCPKCATPERISALLKNFNITDRREAQKHYLHTTKGLAARRRARLQYVQTKKSAKSRREIQLHYAQSEKGRKALREAQARYRQSAKGKAAYERALARRHELTANPTT